MFSEKVDFIVFSILYFLLHHYLKNKARVIYIPYKY